MTRKPSLRQPVDDGLEVEAAEVVAVQQQHGVAVGRALGRRVHVGHAHVLVVDADVEVLARIRVRTLVAGDAARLDVGGRGRPGRRLGLCMTRRRRADRHEERKPEGPNHDDLQ